MHAIPPTAPPVGPAELARRIDARPSAAHLAAARWLLAPRGDWPGVLHPYRDACPDPAALLRLLCFFEPPPEAGPDPLLAHLDSGWRRGEPPAPWFDPLGYEVLSADRRDPPEAALLHYAREGWARGLDPDPRGICSLSGLHDASLVLAAGDAAQAAAVLAFLDRHGGSGPDPVPDRVLLDTSPGHAVARAVAAARPGPVRRGALRLVAADMSLDTAEDRAALVRREAAGARLVFMPLPPPAMPAVPQPAAPSAPALHLTPRRERLRRGEIAPRITLRCPAPDRARAHRWGDFHFAESLAAALRKSGCDTHIALAEDWESPQDPAPDATLLLRGVRRCRPRPGPVNLMWMLSHPDRVEMQELARYDHVFVASLPHAMRLRPALGDRVSALLQCSDPDRFAPGAADPGTEDATPAHPLLFVGNSRKSERWVVSAALEAGHALALYGAEWEDTPAAPHVLAESLPNTRLGSYYRRAGIVLNDHWPDMAARGFVSNRLFDVAMAGGFVLSDSFAGAGMFFGQLAQADTPDALDRAIRHFTANPEERARRATGLHALVRHHHTFDARAATLLARLRQLF